MKKQRRNVNFYFNVSGLKQEINIAYYSHLSEMTVRKSGLKRKYANFLGLRAYMCLGPSAELYGNQLQLHNTVLNK